jgi:hypothetical protein
LLEGEICSEGENKIAKNQIRTTMTLKIRIEPIMGIFLSEGTPSTIYLQKYYFLPFFSFGGEKLHLSFLAESVFCHFHEIGGKWLTFKEKMDDISSVLPNE